MLKFKFIILPAAELQHYLDAGLAAQISATRASVLYRNLFPLGSTLDQLSEREITRRPVASTLPPSVLMDEMELGDD